MKIAKKDTTFKQLFSMNTFIMVIGAVGLIFNNLIVAAIDGNAGIFITSLAGLLNSDSAILGSFELFSIWQLILTAMGLHRVGQLSKTVSVIIVIIFFLIGLGFAAIGTMFLRNGGSIMRKKVWIAIIVIFLILLTTGVSVYRQVFAKAPMVQTESVKVEEISSMLLIPGQLQLQDEQMVYISR